MTTTQQWYPALRRKESFDDPLQALGAAGFSPAWANSELKRSDSQSNVDAPPQWFYLRDIIDGFKARVVLVKLGDSETWNLWDVVSEVSCATKEQAEHEAKNAGTRRGVTNTPGAFEWNGPPPTETRPHPTP